MANITIQVPDALMPRIQTAVTATYGYMAQIPDPQDPTKQIPNPETPADLTKRLLREYLKGIVVTHEANQAQQTQADKVRGEFG